VNERRRVKAIRQKVNRTPNGCASLVIRANGGRRLKSGPTEVIIATQTAAWPWVRACVASRFNYTPDRR